MDWVTRARGTVSAKTNEAKTTKATGHNYELIAIWPARSTEIVSYNCHWVDERCRSYNNGVSHGFSCRYNKKIALHGDISPCLRGRGIKTEISRFLAPAPLAPSPFSFDSFSAQSLAVVRCAPWPSRHCCAPKLKRTPSIHQQMYTHTLKPYSM